MEASSPLVTGVALGGPFQHRTQEYHPIRGSNGGEGKRGVKGREEERRRGQKERLGGERRKGQRSLQADLQLFLGVHSGCSILRDKVKYLSFHSKMHLLTHSHGLHVAMRAWGVRGGACLAPHIIPGCKFLFQS